MVLLFFATAFGAGWLFTHLKSELSPLEDRGTIIGVIVAPEGATLAYTDNYARQLEQFYQAIPEVSSYLVFRRAGAGKTQSGDQRLVVRAAETVGTAPAQAAGAIAKELAPKMFGGLPGVLAFPINPPSLGQSFRNPAVQFVIQSSSYADLQQRVDQVLAKARQYPGMVESGHRFAPEQAATLGRAQA
jgi:multidrug efflux pump